MSLHTPTCPGCSSPLVHTSDGELDTWQCPMLHGSAMTLTEAHGRLQDDEVHELWAATRAATPGAGTRPCPICELGMRAVLVSADGDEIAEGDVQDGPNGVAVWLDVCEPCQLIWLDAGELADFPLNAVNPPVSDAERQQVELVTRQFGEALLEAASAREEQTFTEKIYRTVGRNRTLLHALTTVGRVGRG